MRSLKKMSVTGVIIFSLCLIASASNAEADSSTPKVLVNNNGQQQKLNESLKETDLEIKIRQKIEKELQDKEEFANAPVKGTSALNEKHSWWYVALMYFPNRMIDLSDMSGYYPVI